MGSLLVHGGHLKFRPNFFLFYPSPNPQKIFSELLYNCISLPKESYSTQCRLHHFGFESVPAALFAEGVSFSCHPALPARRFCCSVEI